MEKTQIENLLLNKIGKIQNYKCLINPETIQEKLKYLNITNHGKLKTDCADKLKVKQYIYETIGKEYYAKVLGIWDDATDINWDILPNKFVLKTNQGWHLQKIVLNKNSIDKKQIIKQLNEWKNNICSINSLEFQYTNIERKIFAEEYIETKDELLDYRFWCLNGKVHFIAINGEIGQGPQQFYDTKFNNINLYNSAHIPPILKKYEKPKKLDEMIFIAEELAKPFKFVRIDFYYVNDDILISEMTFSPTGYNFHFVSREGENLDYKIGSKLIIK